MQKGSDARTRGSSAAADVAFALTEPRAKMRSAAWARRVFGRFVVLFERLTNAPLAQRIAYGENCAPGVGKIDQDGADQ